MLCIVVVVQSPVWVSESYSVFGVTAQCLVSKNLAEQRTKGKFFGSFDGSCNDRNEFANIVPTRRNECDPTEYKY